LIYGGKKENGMALQVAALEAMGHRKGRKSRHARGSEDLDFRVREEVQENWGARDWGGPAVPPYELTKGDRARQKAELDQDIRGGDKVIRATLAHRC